MSANPHAYLTDAAQAEAVESIERLDEAGRFYHMTCAYDYEALPRPLLAKLGAGCSTFFAPNTAGEHLLCRNYDFSHFLNNDRHNPRTGVNVVVESASPKARYRSLGVCDAFWLDYEHGSFAEGSLDDGVTDVSALALAPYVCMDGINERGLGVSVMQLSPVATEWEEIPYEEWEGRLTYGIEPLVLEGPGEVPAPDYIRAAPGFVAVNHTDRRAWVAHPEMFRTTMPGKPCVLPPVMMRMMLDGCADVSEAVAVADSLNITATGPGPAYHILVADRTGASRLLEWVDNTMNVIDASHATNYRVSADDGFHGVCRRDECIKAGLARLAKGGMREDYAQSLLQLVSQDAATGNDHSKTQYSCIYNLDRLTLRAFAFGDFTRSWDFAL